MRQSYLIVANEPRVYREVIAGVCATLRPEIEVVLADPSDLDQIVQYLRPDAVICSQPALLQTGASPSLLVLYPGGSSVCIERVGTHETRDLDIQMEGILHFVDRATQQSHSA